MFCIFVISFAEIVQIIKKNNNIKIYLMKGVDRKCLIMVMML